MEHLIDKLARDAGVDKTEVNLIFMSFTNQLVGKVPALKQVIDDVFGNAGNEILRTDINKLILQLQEQQGKETFGKWIIPMQDIVIKHKENNAELF